MNMIQKERTPWLDRIGQNSGGLIIVFVLGCFIVIFLMRTVPAARLVGVSTPVALQYVSGNQARSAAILVGGDAVHGTLQTATRSTKAGDAASIRLAPDLAKELQTIYALWCSDERPATPRPRGEHYEIVVACGDRGEREFSFYFPPQDVPPAFMELERTVPTLTS
jgi:hypothetical protein